LKGSEPLQTELMPRWGIPFKTVARAKNGCNASCIRIVSVSWQRKKPNIMTVMIPPTLSPEAKVILCRRLCDHCGFGLFLS